jgi:hypothetical protein
MKTRGSEATHCTAPMELPQEQSIDVSCHCTAPQPAREPESACRGSDPGKETVRAARTRGAAMVHSAEDDMPG